MDGVIQNNQPVFIMVWLSSALLLLLATVLGLWELQGLNRFILITACTIFLLGVQLPTVVFNIPINNQLQSKDINSMNQASVSELRTSFETRWIPWNNDSDHFCNINITSSTLTFIHTVSTHLPH